MAAGLSSTKAQKTGEEHITRGLTQAVGLLGALFLGVCGSTQQATEAARGTWVGRPADQFFAKNGPPLRQYQMAGGGKVFGWETVDTPSGKSRQLVCSADLVTDAVGMIREIRLKENTIGHWNTSRCSEVFGQ